MLGYEAMAIAAKDPNVEISWGYQSCWWTYEEMTNPSNQPLSGYAQDGFVTRKVTPKPELPEKIAYRHGFIHETTDTINQLIDYLKAKEEE